MNQNKEKNFISAVIYIKNNESEIEHFLGNLHSVLDRQFEKFEIICVDDASKDGTIQRVRSFGQEHSVTISIIHMSYPQGLEMAMNAGVDLAIGDFVYEFDHVYLDYAPSLIFDIYTQSLKGFDIVSAAPKQVNHFSSRLFYALFNRNSKNPNQLKTESFRVLSRRAINRIQSLNKTVPYRKAVYATCGLKEDTIFYTSTFKTPKNQESRFRSGVAIDALILFTDITFKISLTMSILMMLSVLGIGIYAIWIFLTYKPVEGWTTTMLLLSGAFFGVFSILTIIIKYLSLIIELIFKKQNYVIEPIEKVS